MSYTMQFIDDVCILNRNCFINLVTWIYFGHRVFIDSSHIYIQYKKTYNYWQK